MEKRTFKDSIVEYDEKHDIFYIVKKNKEVSHSVDLEDFVVDLDKNNEIVGLEIFGISKLTKIPKKYFNKLQNAKLVKSYRRNGEIIALYLILQFKIKSKIQEVQQGLYFGNPIKSVTA